MITPTCPFCQAEAVRPESSTFTCGSFSSETVNVQSDRCTALERDQHRLRIAALESDLQAAQGSPQFTAQIQRDAEGVEPKSDLELDEHTKLCRRTELEFIAQEFMKALLANPGNFGRSAWPVIDMAYEAARAFIDEREKRRLP